MTNPTPEPRRATLEDIEKVEALWVPNLGLFDGVSKEVVHHIVGHGVIRAYPADKPVFTQGDVVNDIYVVLEGKFEVIHIWGNEQLTVAIDLPGSMLADVELLVRNAPDEAVRSLRRPGLSPLTTWSSVTCKEAGKVLQINPATELLGPKDPTTGHRDYRMVFNVARILAIKLIKRSAEADPKYLYKGKAKPLLLTYIQGLIELYGLEKDPRKPDYYRIATSIKAANIARTLDLGKATISEFFKQWGEKCSYVGEKHDIVETNDRAYIRMSKAFLEQEIGIMNL